MNNLDKRVALVTGAGSGIGKATALLLAERGARVGLLGRGADKLEQVRAQIGDNAKVLIADISDESQVRSSCDELAREYGRIDIVFANAGINGVWAPIEELKLSEWQQTIDINITGTFLTIKHTVPYLKKQGGSVIVTSSVNGTRIFSNTGATAYSCTKAAQVAMAKMLALELAKWKIRVNVICPGAIETNIEESTEQRDIEAAREPVQYLAGKIPLTDGKPGSAEQVARLVAFLASDESSHITGTEMWIDGAESLLVG